MPAPQAAAGQIWQDDCYYLDTTTGNCMRKFVLVLAVNAASGDSVTAVFTSRPNGLPETPACHIGHPRSGYFLGIPGGVLLKPTWVDFSSIETLDSYDLNLHVQSGRKTLLPQALPPARLCAVLRCVLQCDDDISLRESRWLGDTVAALNCP